VIAICERRVTKSQTRRKYQQCFDVSPTWTRKNKGEATHLFTNITVFVIFFV